MDFFDDVPLMPDAMQLWTYILPYHPIILSGAPKIGHEKAANGKIKWCEKHLGHVDVRICLSKEKFKHCQPMDIIIDDRDKYRGSKKVGDGSCIRTPKIRFINLKSMDSKYDIRIDKHDAIS